MLVPQEAPPLAAQLRAHTTSLPVVPHIVDPIPDKPRVPKNPSPLGGETIWYRDPDRKQLHSELGMEWNGRD